MCNTVCPLYFFPPKKIAERAKVFAMTAARLFAFVPDNRRPACARQFTKLIARDSNSRQINMLRVSHNVGSLRLNINILFLE
jgi:hypothetical protein